MRGAGGIAPFFFAGRQLNLDRPAVPVLTVLSLLIGDHQENDDGASERKEGIPGVWAPQEYLLFFAMAVRFSPSSA